MHPEVAEVAGALTPVPGGVGPLTIAMLLRNTLRAAAARDERRRSRQASATMLKVALTGGIATGKSYVLERFAERGVPCLDADALAHGVMAAGTEATTAIAARFGADILDAGRCGRSPRWRHRLRRCRRAARLEAIVHPAVYRAIAAGLRAFELMAARRSPSSIYRSCTKPARQEISIG